MLALPQEKESSNFNDFTVTQGSIKFENYSLKYRSDTELVLKQINFTIDPKEKIGIVGRTGAGKSTICLALCRLVEGYSGRILIDNTDISKVSLSSLRKNLSVITQDPSLFTGSLRFNIDPEGKISDYE